MLYKYLKNYIYLRNISLAIAVSIFTKMFKFFNSFLIKLIKGYQDCPNQQRPHETSQLQIPLHLPKRKIQPQKTAVD